MWTIEKKSKIFQHETERFIKQVHFKLYNIYELSGIKHNSWALLHWSECAYAMNDSICSVEWIV